jgi:hypothetical protein
MAWPKNTELAILTINARDPRPRSADYSPR